MQNMFCFCVRIVLSSRLEKGEMPEWSNGPHSKCGIRVTVSRVRIPVSPQRDATETSLFFFHTYFNIIVILFINKRIKILAYLFNY